MSPHFWSGRGILYLLITTSICLCHMDLRPSRTATRQGGVLILVRPRPSEPTFHTRCTHAGVHSTHFFDGLVGTVPLACVWWLASSPFHACAVPFARLGHWAAFLPLLELIRFLQYFSMRLRVSASELRVEECEKCRVVLRGLLTGREHVVGGPQMRATRCCTMMLAPPRKLSVAICAPVTNDQRKSVQPPRLPLKVTSMFEVGPNCVCDPP